MSGPSGIDFRRAWLALLAWEKNEFDFRRAYLALLASISNAYVWPFWHGKRKNLGVWDRQRREFGNDENLKRTWGSALEIAELRIFLTVRS
jgi:hypothetical protein